MTLIFIEGPDASGKSTLIKGLVSQPGSPFQELVREHRGPFKEPGEYEAAVAEIKLMAETLNPSGLYLVDRHPVISESVYGSVMKGKPLDLMSKDPYNLEGPLVVLRPLGFRDHHLADSAKDGPEYLARLNRLHDEVERVYRESVEPLADDVMDVRIYPGYAQTVHRLSWLIYSCDPMIDVRRFNQKFCSPRQPPGAIREYDQLRSKKLVEECAEFAEALESGPRADVLDSLVDIAYVAIATAENYGWDFTEAWSRVHKANMAKQRAAQPNQSKHGSKLDIIKPKGWVGPNLGDLV